MSFRFDHCEVTFPCGIVDGRLHVTVTPDYTLTIPIDYKDDIPMQCTGFTGSQVSFCLEAGNGVVVGYRDGTWLKYRLSDYFILARGKWDASCLLLKVGELHTNYTDCAVYTLRNNPWLGIPARGTKLIVFPDKLRVEDIIADTRPIAKDGRDHLTISFTDGSTKDYYLTIQWKGVPMVASKYTL